MVTKKEVLRKLEKVVDPELGIPITELNFIDKIEVRKNKVKIEFHLTSHFCPPFFALMIAKGIKENVKKIKGVKEVEVKLKNHFAKDLINKELEKI